MFAYGTGRPLLCLRGGGGGRCCACGAGLATTTRAARNGPAAFCEELGMVWVR